MASISFIFTLLMIVSTIIIPNSTRGGETIKTTVKGSLVFGKTTINYNDGVAVTGIFDGVSKTIVYLTDKMGDRNEIIKGLLKNGSYGSTSNRLELSFDPKGNLKYYFFYLREAGRDQNVGKAPENIKSETTLAKNQVKGHVVVQKPLEVFDKKYTFDVTFHVENVTK